jgi:hypothetical protein
MNNDMELPELSDDEMMDPVEKQELDLLKQIADAITQSVQLQQANIQAMQQLAQVIQHMGRPKRVVRGPDNRVIGIE